MKKVIEILDRYYQAFINQQRDWDFFLGLADYVKYATETPKINDILKSIVQARDNDQKGLKEYGQRVIKETKQAKEKLFEIIKKHKISYESLDRAIEKYQGYENSTIISSRTKVEALSDALADIIRCLFEKGYKELVRDFAIEHKEIPNAISRYTFSKTLDLYEKEKEVFNEKIKTELWASWNNLVLAYLTVFRANEELKKLRKDEKDFFKAWNFAVLVGEMRKIRDGNINRLTGIASDFEPIHFKKGNYISHATRIHNYLIRELSKEEAKKPLKKEKTNAKAQYDNGILYFRNKEIDFRNKQNQKDLLATLFEDPEKNWYYDEIQDKWDEMIRLGAVDRKKDYWKKFYSAGDNINAAIAIETQVKDFIIKNTKEIRINPKYV